MKHAAIYIRVSTDEQAEQGYSIDAQKEKLTAYCVSQGLDHFKLYIDDGYTGTNMERPAFRRMVRHIQEGKISAVIVRKLDRLSRKQKDVMTIIEDIFEKNNVSFTSTTELFDTSTPFGKAMIGVLAVFAQLDRDMIVERTTMGRRQRVNTGRWYGGRVPFGYKWNKELQELEIVPEEARIVKRIFQMYSEGHSRLEIAEWAASRTNERMIDHSVIRDMLERVVYIGKLRNAGQIVDGLQEPIISQKLWDAVRAEAVKRKDGALPKGDFLLTGVMKCGVCEGNIVHVKRCTKVKDKEYNYELYACKKQHVRIKDRVGKCNLGYFRRENIEQFVVDQIKFLATYPEKITELMNEEKEMPDDEISYEQLQAELKKVNTNLENLYDAIESGDLKASSVSDRIRKLEEKRELLENDIDELTDNKLPTADEKTVRAVISDIGSAWNYFTEEEQKTAIRKLIKHVVLEKDGRHHIEWIFSF
ncbi:recombinase family protein [Paenibacillus polymyxa]|uniref:recombinase family protein n=1 Tax=Paenibacillus polymyxa TaxID=1406 RepID=UPI002023FACC|nr:recombinase family protein [Paenibacillus polymyxa]URJ46431.1 recombinase family protein [Paenibacillus polymyxa]